MQKVIVVEYDPVWPERFKLLKSRIEPALSGIASSIEHVGSTAIPGLAAKPVIDISVVVETVQLIEKAIEQLEILGYKHRGQMGVEGREAFDSPSELPSHHLYVCLRGSIGLSNHLIIREYLLANPEVAIEYGSLKKVLAKRFSEDRSAYLDGKTDFLVGILSRSGMSQVQLQAVEQSNRKPG